MQKIFYLKTCDTCKKILSQIAHIERFELREIKSQPITEEELEQLYDITKSYELLVNKRAQLYKKLGLKEKKLTEKDYKKYLLEHYTFLSRPIIILENQIFVGNNKYVVEKMLRDVNQ